jgi:hypothetical protein
MIGEGSRTARSLMSRANISSDHTGRVIARVRGVYDRHEFHAEKEQAFEALAPLIDRIVNPNSNIVRLDDARLPAADSQQSVTQKSRTDGKNSAAPP